MGIGFGMRVDRSWQGERGAPPRSLALASDAAGIEERLARARAHMAARRHSRRVRLLKWAIPLGALVAAGAAAAVTAIQSHSSFPGLTLGGVTISGTQVTMEKPRLTGYRAQSGPYEVTATAALQDVRRPGEIEMRDFKARLAVDERGATARLEAARGLLDTKRETFELKENVLVRSDAGQEVRLASALVDFRAGTVVSREAVTVSFENGTIEAAGVEVSDNGRVMQFKGRVRATFSGDLSEAVATARGGPPATRTSQAEASSLR